MNGNVCDLVYNCDRYGIFVFNFLYLLECNWLMGSYSF